MQSTYTYTSESTTRPATESEALSDGLGMLAGAGVGLFIFGTLCVIYSAAICYKISKKMGKSTLFAIMSIFFWPICGGILAFSKGNDLDFTSSQPMQNQPGQFNPNIPR